MFKKIDNFLNKKDFKDIYSLLTSEFFPWYFNNYKGNSKEKVLEYQFTHIFFDKEVKSNLFQYLSPLIKKLKPKNILRIKANLNPATQKLIEFTEHKDIDEANYQSAIFYINNNNGYTKIKK